MKFLFASTSKLLAVLVIVAVGCAKKDNSSAADAGVDAAAVSRGLTAVKTRDCASCHAAADKSLSGSTTARPGTQAYAANLTPDKDTGIGEWTTQQIVQAILTGVDDEGATLCEIMPRFGGAGMAKSEAEDIAAYLQSLAPVMHEIPESTCAGK